MSNYIQLLNSKLDRYKLNTETSNVIWAILRELDFKMQGYYDDCNDPENQDNIDFYRGKHQAAFYILEHIEDMFSPLQDD
jgi:hypothetical protein